MQLKHRAATAAVAQLKPSGAEEHRGGGGLNLPRGYLQHYGIGDPPGTITVGGKVVLTGNPSAEELLKMEQALGPDVTNSARAAARKGVDGLIEVLKPYLEQDKLNQPIVQQLADAYVRFVARQDADAVRTKINNLLATYPKGTMPPQVIALVRDEIVKLPSDERAGYYLALQEMSRYNNQRDNHSMTTGSIDKRLKKDTPADDENMCNLTTLAMILESVGKSNPNPKDYPQFEDYLEWLRIDKRLGIRADRTTVMAVSEAMGVHAALLYDSKTLKQKDWFALRDKYLATGKGIMLHVPGHFIRLQAVTETGIVIDDPIGREQIINGSRGRTHDNAVGTYDNQGEDNRWGWEIEKFQLRGVVAFG